MKKNKFLKFLLNKWTLIIAGVLVVVVAAGIVLGLNWNNWFGKDEGKKETKTTAAEAKGIFWNVDRYDYIYYDSSVRPTVRTRDKTDGLYHVLFCCLTEQGRAVNLRVKSDPVMKKIDQYMAMSLVKDEDGIVIDCVPIEDMNKEISLYRGYVMEDSVEGQPVKLNTADNGQGIDFEVEIPEEVPKYDISGSSGDIGARITNRISEGDCVYLISDTKTGKINYALLLERSVIGTIYWNKERMYDSKFGMSTRKVGADGYFSFELAYDGTVGTFKTKDVDVVKAIDSLAARAFGLELDPETNEIIRFITAKDTTHGPIVASYYSVMAINENKVDFKYVSQPTSASFGKTCSYELSKSFKAMDVSEVKGAQYAAYTDLRIGDKVQCYSNSRGKIAFAHVVGSRTVDSDLYWSTSRKWDTTKKAWTRKPDAEGKYVYDVYSKSKPGVLQKVWTRDPVIGEYIDKTFAAPIFGLKLSANNEILEVYGPADVVGGNSVGSYYLVESIVGDTLNLYYPSNNNKAHGTLSKNVVIINTQKKCKYDTINVGDKVHSILNNMGEISVIYIINKAPVVVKTAYCDHCNKVVQWYSYTGMAATEDKHYVMMDDYDDSSVFNVGSTGNTVFNLGDNTHKPVDVVLDLAGHKINANFRAVDVQIGCKFTLMDSVGGGSISSINPTLATDNGLAIRVKQLATFDFKSGTVDMSNTNAGLSGCSAPTVYLMAGSTMNMYNGAVIKGARNCYKLANGHDWYAGGLAGSLAVCGKTTITDSKTSEKKSVDGAQVNMFGGVITGGQVFNADPNDLANAHSCTGGNVYIYSGAVYNMYNGEISNGVAEGMGGNVYIASGGTMNLYGGVIKNGVANKRKNAAGELVDGAGGNISMGGTLNVKGNPQVTGSTVYVGIKKSINIVGVLEPTVRIGVDVGGGGVFAKNAKQYKDNFVAPEGAEIQVVGDDLAIYYTGHTHCVCGATDLGAPAVYTHTAHSLVTYQPLTQADISGNGGMLPTEGNYYLAENVELSGQASGTGDLNLCYNGHTVSYVVPASAADHSYQRIYLLGNVNKNAAGQTITSATVTFTDCQSGGGMKKTDGKSTASGALIQVNGAIKVTLNIYNGKYDIGGVFSASTTGGGFRLLGSTELNVFGGEFIGAKQTANGNIFNVAATASVNLYGGTFKNNAGTVATGTPGSCGIYLADSAKLKLAGNATIDGTNGANIYNANNNTVEVDPAFTGKAAVTMITPGVIARTTDKSDASAVKSKFIVPEITNYQFIADGAELKYRYLGHTHCSCGQVVDGAKNVGAHTSHSAVYYQPLDQATVNKLGGRLPANGDYFLAEDITVKTQQTQTGTLNLCYNGNTITIKEENIVDHSSTRMYLMAYNVEEKSVANFSDCKTGGGMKKIDSKATATGALLFLYTTKGPADVNFFAGTYDAGEIVDTGNGCGLMTIAGTYKTTVNVYDGATFIGAKAATQGNIFNLQNANATLNIYGGKFQMPEGATVGGGAILAGVGTVNISGAPEFSGVGPVVVGSKTFSIKGAPVFKDGAKIIIPNGKTINVTDLEAEADINVEVVAGGIFAKNAKQYKDNFTSDEANAIEVVGDDLNYKFTSDHVHCVCGQVADGATAVNNHTSHKDVPYYGLTQSNITNIFGGKLPQAGNYYLKEDVKITSSSANNGELNICFNGHTVTMETNGSSDRILNLGSVAPADMLVANTKSVSVNFSDCGEGGGMIRKDAKFSDSASMFYIYGNHQVKLNFFGGKFDAGETSVAKSGGILWISAPAAGIDASVANVYGGEFIGAAKAYQGNVFYLDSWKASLNIYGGTMVGGNATQFGGTISSCGAVTLSGGTIMGGSSTAAASGLGGNIYVRLSGKFTMTGGSVEGGEAIKGGNIYLCNTTANTISGGTIKDGVASANGDNVFFTGANLNFSGNVAFDGADNDDIYVALAANKLVVGTLGNDVHVKVLAGFDGVFTSGGASEASKFSTDAGHAILTDGSNLKIVSP